jgi:outer membrane protein OmpA-like peptidoglycan-associated protein
MGFFCLQLWAASGASAQPSSFPLHVRAGAALATMVSKDQNGRLGFDEPGIAFDLQLGYSLLPWLDVRVGGAAGGFPKETGTGGLLQPQLGAAIAWPAALRPWLQVDVGAGFTGDIVRPALRASIGLDLRVGFAFTLSPVIGYWQLFQHNGKGASTDARFLFFGVALGWEPFLERPAPEQRERVVVRERMIMREAQPVEIPPREHDAPEPSPELISLIESTLPTQQQEWLAPVLFAYNSDVLEAQGVAMLHEVALELEKRPNLKRLEIRGYADVRGSQEHNLALSKRRAQAVLGWLVAHGIERERLSVAAQGAQDFVERGPDETAHEQNRRVVFRVLEAEQP